MTKRMLKLVAWVYAFFGLTGGAQAGMIPSGAFSISTGAVLAILLLLPFQILGCVGG